MDTKAVRTALGIQLEETCLSKMPGTEMTFGAVKCKPESEVTGACSLSHLPLESAAPCRPAFPVEDQQRINLFDNSSQDFTAILDRLGSVYVSV